MAKYRKKPVVTEAVRWNGKYSDGTEWPDWFRDQEDSIFTMNEDRSLNVRTLEGTMRADVGDFIIRGVKGEVYPCKPDIFEATYDRVE